MKGDCGGADAEPLLSTADFPATLVFLLFFLLSGIFSPLLLPASVNCPLGEEGSRQISIPSSSILIRSARTGLRDSRGGGSVSRGLVSLGGTAFRVWALWVGRGRPHWRFSSPFPFSCPSLVGGALMAMGGFSWALTRHPSQRWMSREPANGLPASCLSPALCPHRVGTDERYPHTPSWCAEESQLPQQLLRVPS